MNKTGNEGRLRDGTPGVKNISFCAVLCMGRNGIEYDRVRITVIRIWQIDLPF
jgi:hypothetical protein